MEFTYEQIKSLAKQTGRKVTDLIALASQNDPFYQGTPGQQELAEWFAEIYHNQHWYNGRNHIRRCHYQILSLELTLPNGKPYENTENCWDTLNAAAKAARYLHLVDMASFDDRRNAEPLSFAASWYQPDISVNGYVYSSELEVPDFPSLPNYNLSDFYGNQRYHLEIWCEKTTMNDVLEPLCREYGMVLQTASGEQSITAARLLAERVQEQGKPTRVFYISDFDPAGKSMPVAVARKLEYFVRNEIQEDIDVRLFPLVLTLDQVKQYHLPRTPIKETEKRRGHFELQHGTGAVELDALEALRPGELERIMRGYIRRYFDASLNDRVRNARTALEQRLRRVRQAILEQHQSEIEQVHQELNQIKQTFEPRMAEYAGHVRNLWEVIESELEEEKPYLDLEALPGASEGNEIDDGLYNSTRPYLDQIEVYKAFQGK